MKSKSIKINFEVLKTYYLLKGFLLPCWLLRITSLPSTKFSSCVLCPWRLCFGGAGVREHDPSTSPRDWAKGKQSWCAVGSSSSWTKGFHEIFWFCGVWLVLKESLFPWSAWRFWFAFWGVDIMMIGCEIVTSLNCQGGKRMVCGCWKPMLTRYQSALQQNAWASWVSHVSWKLKLPSLPFSNQKPMKRRSF